MRYFTCCDRTIAGTWLSLGTLTARKWVEKFRLCGLDCLEPAASCDFPRDRDSELIFEFSEIFPKIGFVAILASRSTNATSSLNFTGLDCNSIMSSTERLHRSLKLFGVLATSQKRERPRIY